MSFQLQWSEMNSADRNDETDPLAEVPDQSNGEGLQYAASDLLNKHNTLRPTLDQLTFKPGQELKPLVAEPDSVMKMEQTVKQELADRNQELVVTADGASPKPFNYRESVQVEGETNLKDWARKYIKEQSGKEPGATQLQAYCDQLKTLNPDLQDPLQGGEKLKMPGQRADGGIVWHEQDVTKIIWSNGNTLESSASGEGNASFKDKDGNQVTGRWVPDAPQLSTMERQKGDRGVVVTRPDGIEEEFLIKDNQSGERVRTKYSGKDEQGLLRTITFDPKTGEAASVVVSLENGDKLTSRKPTTGDDWPAVLTDKDGKPKSVDYKIAGGPEGAIYYKKELEKGEYQKIYKNGTVEKFNSDNQLLNKEGTDSGGRRYIAVYKAGDTQPETYKLTLNGAELTFKRAADGALRNKTETGEQIELDEVSGDVTRRSADGKMARVDRQDGSVVQTIKRPDDSTVEIHEKGKMSITVERDGKGELLQATYSQPDGRSIMLTYDAGSEQPKKIAVRQDGRVTELKSDQGGAWTAIRTDASGKPLERLILSGDKLTRIDAQTQAIQVERMRDPISKGEIAPLFSPVAFDSSAGTVTYQNDNNEIVTEPFFRGKTDTVSGGGALSGRTSAGDESRLTANGEAFVSHADKTGVRLRPDGTIDRWGPSPGDNVYGEKLTTKEAKFLKDHPNIDRRDLIEIHRRFKGNAEKLDSFYSELSKIDDSSNLNDAEKLGLRKSIMHDVAYPAEVYQGRVCSCTAAVLQREMATEDPARYAKILAEAVCEEEVSLADGSKVEVNLDNLKMADSSGRNIAARLFQGIATNVAFGPKFEFVNTEDGVGRIYPIPFDAKTQTPYSFRGIDMAKVAEMEYKLTGKPRAVVFVRSAEELAAAFELNDGRSMSILVNAYAKPFGNKSPDAARDSKTFGSHAVSISGVDKGPPLKFLVRNNWGIESDHSTEATAISADELYDNMRMPIGTGLGAKTGTEVGKVILSNDAVTQGKGYAVRDGKLVESKNFSEFLEKVLQTPAPAYPGGDGAPAHKPQKRPRLQDYNDLPSLKKRTYV